jgi:hypothetical protein
MNEPLHRGNPENQATACDRFRLLKQEYESALQEEALYQYGGAASIRQAMQYESEAKVASTHARHRLIAHYKVCPRCSASSWDPVEK